MTKKQRGASFQKQMEELESITAWFEAGEPDLDQGMEKFARASALIVQMKKRIAEAEQQITVIRALQETDGEDA